MADPTPGVTQVALVTYDTQPGLTDDDRLLAEALVQRGARVTSAVWSDPDVRWDSFDAVIVRSCWDYFHRADEFFAWLDQLDSVGARVLNTTEVLRWNARKSYLRELESIGVPIVPTRWLARGEADSLGALRRDTGWLELVLKPAISGSAHDTWRSSPGDESRDDARLAGMTARGDVLVQPLLDEVVSGGEWSIVFLDGAFSHAVLKRPRDGDFRVQIEHGGTARPATPPAHLVDHAAYALDAAPFAGARALYARVDGCEVAGQFVLMELELIEPVLFFGTCAGAADRLADAIAIRVNQDAEVSRRTVLPTSRASLPPRSTPARASA